jgi:hypothetical protein
MINQTVQQTTQKLIDLLPEDNEHYRLDELRSWGLPSFIVQRIQVELERNLAESMIPPKTDWANTQSDAVLEAWQQFVQAIRDEARLPASYAKAVIETAAADVLDMLTEPRKNIPDVIFGSDDELDFEQLQNRIKAVVVYQHFATLLPRYMEKKNVDVLSRKRCQNIIQKADERLTGNYSPLSWAQTLDPLFNLLDDQVDSSIFRLFFEDKERDRLAEVFEDIDQSLSRAEFIEVLSAPDVVDSPPEPVEAAVAPEVEEQTEEETAGQPTFEELNEDLNAESSETEAMGATEEEPLEMEPESEEKDEEPSQTFTEKEREKTVDPADDEEDGSINTAFGAWTASEEETTSSTNGSDNSISALFSDKPEQEEASPKTDIEPETDDQPEHKEKPNNDEKSGPQVEQEEEDDPIWMRFRSEDEKTSLAEEEAEDDYPVTVEKESEEEVVVDEDERQDHTQVEESDPNAVADQDDEANQQKEVDKLEEQLAERHDHFVESIFGGSEQDYEEALADIVEFDNWRSASKYIQRHVFSRNLVDLYSESAVAFTDRLQNYFLDKENDEPKG